MFVTNPPSSDLSSTPAVLWLWSGRWAISLHLWPVVAPYSHMITICFLWCWLLQKWEACQGNCKLLGKSLPPIRPSLVSAFAMHSHILFPTHTTSLPTLPNIYCVSCAPWGTLLTHPHTPSPSSSHLPVSGQRPATCWLPYWLYLTNNHGIWLMVVIGTTSLSNGISGPIKNSPGQSQLEMGFLEFQWLGPIKD